MAIRIFIGDIKAECDTAEEARELMRLLTKEKAQATPFPRSNGHVSKSNAKGGESGSRSIRFLETVANAGQDGIAAKDLASALKVGDPRALGHVMKGLAKDLGDAGFSLEQALDPLRNAKGTWYRPGTRLSDALTALGKKGG